MQILEVKNDKQKFLRGFTIIEILIVIAILTILVSSILSSSNNVSGSETLNTTVTSVISILNEAKSLAVSSKDASNYGVRILNNKLVSFKNNYGTENKEVAISGLLTVSTSSGIGTDVIFYNVSGNTSASGTVTITVSNDPSEKGIINIYSTGLIEKN